MAEVVDAAGTQENPYTQEVREMRKEMIDALLSSPERSKKIAEALLTSDPKEGFGNDLVLQEGQKTISIGIGRGDEGGERTLLSVRVQDGEDVKTKVGISTTIGSGGATARFVYGHRGMMGVSNGDKNFQEVIGGLKSPTPPITPK